MSHSDDLRKCAAKSLLAGGDRCGLCEYWELVTGWRGDAPAVGDCTAEYDETLRTSTAKTCPKFRRDKSVEEVARTGHRIDLAKVRQELDHD